MDLREFLFRPLEDRRFSFAITARETGVLSGVDSLRERAGDLQLEVLSLLQEGALLDPGVAVLVARANAEQVARAEEELLGIIGKPSGVATAARAMARRTLGARIVCGAWKKVSPAVRADLRRAIATGGAAVRIADCPFIYLDKNYVRMFGSLERAVARAKSYESGRLVAVQLRGEKRPVALEAAAAAESGADIVMVDTGRLADLKAVVAAGEAGGWRGRVQVAFGGGVTDATLAEIALAGADIVDVGRAIIDAPLLDFSLDVEG